MLDIIAVYCTLLASYGHVVFSNPATYDQRQTGDVNVQIHVKDVQVVALVDSELFDGYTDYDYAYDYADFTLKPIVKPTTSTPSSLSTSSVEPLSTSSTKPSTPSSVMTTTANNLTDAESSSSKVNVTQESTSSPINKPDITTIETTQTAILQSNVKNETAVKLRMNDKVGHKLFDIVDDKDFSSTTKQASLRKSSPSGYAPGKQKRCQRIQKRRRIALVPLTMRLSSKLSERGRFTVRKDLPIRVYKSDPQL